MPIDAIRYKDSKLNTRPASVDMPKVEKIKAAVMIVALIFFFGFLIIKLHETGKNQALILSVLLLVALYKNGLRLWLAQVSCRANTLQINSAFGITKIAENAITRIKHHPQTKGWLNPKYGYFIIETSQSDKRHYVVALSQRNKNDLEQFFAAHFPEQYQAVDSIVAALSP